MCGLCGIQSAQDNPAKRDLVEKMSSSLVHRGPDEYGYYCDDDVAFGHRRLSIIDLDSGRQPLFNEDKSLVLIFNGEIYNYRELTSQLQKKGHRFCTSTDSEVILHLYEEYGLDCLLKLSGMFAFSVWDKENKRLFLARDRVGIKPLVYACNNGHFLFASEINSIVASGLVSRKLDYDALHLYFTFGYIPAPWTIYKDIKKLLPGHYILLEKGNLKITRYWQLSVSESNLSFSDAREQLSELLKNSIKSHMISDVPVGAFLSGGVDSSAVVALMSEFSEQQIHTCTIGYRDHQFYDETTYARRVASIYPTNHREYFLSKNDFLDVIPYLINKLGEPFADPSLIPTYYLSKRMRESVKVALSGDGADELFAGYDKYLGEYWHKYFSHIPAPLIQRFLKPLLNILPGSRSNFITEFIRKLKRFVAGLENDPMLRHFRWMEIFSEDVRRQLLKTDSSLLGEELIRDAFYGGAAGNGQVDAINRTLKVDFNFILPNDMLTKVDLAGMWNSLEVRVPFLDHQLVEFIFSLKGAYKFYKQDRKIVLKKTIERYLPREIIDRPKHGFDIPVGEWFKRELRSSFFETVDEKIIEKQGLFNYPVIARLYECHRNNLEDKTRQLWSIYLFQCWMNQNEIEL
jgi:asparagine synthase (glutamine-hydrolysing)